MTQLLWRAVSDAQNLDLNLDAYTPAAEARSGKSLWRYQPESGEWRYAPGLDGVPGDRLVSGAYGPVFQSWSVPLSELIAPAADVLIGEAAVTEPDIRARALDAAVKIIGQADLPEATGLPIDSWSWDLAKIYTAAARALEPYLRGDQEGTL